MNQKYRKMTQLEHVYELPDSYVGSIDKQQLHTYVYDKELDNISSKQIEYVPGLYKIYDEIIVNALDQYVRLLNARSNIPVTYVKISISAENNEISICNDGQGIEVVWLDEYKCYAPDLIFGQLLTSSNYDKNEDKVTGGKNGFGAKLTNIFSTQFIVETIDHVRKLKYTHVYKDNMKQKMEPVITNSNSSPYTRITFQPDLKRFGLNSLSDDFIGLLRKRVYDVAAWTNSSVKVYFNEKLLPCSQFKSYVDMYIGERPRVYKKFNSNWEIVATYNTDEVFEQVSFVNGINTIRGGKHVDYISNQICRQLAETMTKKFKMNIKPVYVKNQLFLFVKSTIVNPSFDGQTKETLTTPASKFGSTCVIDSKFIQELLKTSIVDRIVQQAEYKNNKALKKTDGKKLSSIRGIPKLCDANKAGGRQSQKCTLILTEGDSAKTMAIAGLSEVGRDYYGVFPLKGKVLNVKDADANKLAKNAEITNLKKIIGLKTGEVYTKDTKPWPLRYGRIIIMTDQDVDGTHIKGLIMNVFHSHWLSLLQLGFVTSLLTPIIKATKGKKQISFYTLSDYEKWKLKQNKGKWKIKYYKGLGTSTTKEAKEYFKTMKIVNYDWNSQKSDNALDLAFNKSRADDRKEWLQGYDKEVVLDSTEEHVTFDEFIHKDLIHFSNYNVQRAIPSMVDGLKPSQRKVLYSCFKRNLMKEIRVAQLAGYVSEHSAYHHGEASLQDTIIGLAQTFVGTNNINYLLPNGTFGSRLQGGKDSASPRYIYTCLNPITKYIFRPEDEPILNYLDDDGLSIEPDYYLPIIPTILLNGVKGIGTGYSTSIPAFNPSTLIKNMKRIIENRDLVDKKLGPWYTGHKGKMISLSDNVYLSKGLYEIVNSTTVRVTELPVGVWTDKYKEYLESVIVDSKNRKKKQFIEKYVERSTESTVCIDIIMNYRTLLTLRQMNKGEYTDAIEDKLHLSKRISMTNMHVYNEQGHVQKMDSAETIMKNFYTIRIGKYGERREYWLSVYEKELRKIELKVRFIMEILNDTLDLRKKKQADIVKMLEEKGYETLYSNQSKQKSYDYLVKMPLHTLSMEMVEKLHKELEEKKIKYESLKNTTSKQLWLRELRELHTMYKSQQKQLKTK